MCLRGDVGFFFKLLFYQMSHVHKANHAFWFSEPCLGNASSFHLISCFVWWELSGNSAEPIFFFYLLGQRTQQERRWGKAPVQHGLSSLEDLEVHRMQNRYKYTEQTQWIYTYWRTNQSTCLSQLIFQTLLSAWTQTHHKILRLLLISIWHLSDCTRINLEGLHPGGTTWRPCWKQSS